jgi:large subunit ribosomal protein L15
MIMSNIQGLHNLVSAPGSRKKPKRVGRGESSGLGKTSGRGHKGQKARKSGNVRPGFEGGQLPLARRLPKRGFSNSLFRTKWTVINVASLNDRFESGDNVTKLELVLKGLIQKPQLPVKILGNGDLTIALTIQADSFSETAKNKIESAGGKVVFAETANSEA